MPPAEALTRGHAETARMDVHELARQLTLHLGPTLVALLAGVRDRKLPTRWAKADGPQPRKDSERRLRTAHRAWLLLAAAETDHVARAWFIGTNPRLGETTPVEALRDDRDAEVMAAASAFVDGTDE